MSEIRVGFAKPDEFSSVPNHTYDANSRRRLGVSYSSREDAAEESVDQTALPEETTTDSTDTVLELDTLTPLE